MSSNSIYYEPTAEVSQQGAAQSDQVESEKSDSEPDEATVYKSRVSFSTPRDAGLLDTHLRSESLSFSSWTECTKGSSKFHAVVANYETSICESCGRSDSKIASAVPCKENDCLRRENPYLRSQKNVYFASEQGCSLMDVYGLRVLRTDQVLVPSTPIKVQSVRLNTSFFVWSGKTFRTFSDMQVFLGRTRTLLYKPFPLRFQTVMLQGIPMFSAAAEFLSETYKPERRLTERDVSAVTHMLEAHADEMRPGRLREAPYGGRLSTSAVQFEEELYSIFSNPNLAGTGNARLRTRIRPRTREGRSSSSKAALLPIVE